MRVICLLCLVLGYGFGLIQTAYLYANSRNIDIQNEGSGNAGTTNMIRVMGIRAGMITFLGDIAKLVLAVLLVKAVFIWFLHLNIDPMTLVLYTGFGVVLGHNYPFYLGFKGGKGVAVSAAVIVCLWDWRLILICAVVFFAVAIATKYISLASMCMMAAFVISFVIFILTDVIHINDRWKPDTIILAVLLAALCIWQHRSNISRLAMGLESKFSFSSQKKEASEAGELVQAQVKQNKEDRREYRTEKREAKAEYKEIKREAKEEYKKIRMYKPTKRRRQKLMRLQEAVHEIKDQERE